MPLPSREEPVDADDVAFRRVQPVLVVTDTKAQGGRRASSAAFTDDSDGSPMSTYLDSVVRQLGLGPDGVVWGKTSGWGVAAIPVAVLVDEQQRVVRNPVIDAEEPHPCDPAHALVHGEKKSKSRRERIARDAPLVYIVS